MIQLGNHLWATCEDCGKLVKITGWLRGIHFCLTPEEIAAKRQMLAMSQRQGNAESPSEMLASLMKGRAAD